MRRLFAVLAGAGLAVGGGAAAWAGPGGSGGPNREAAKACLAQARQDNPEAARAELKDVVKACLGAAGIKPGEGRELTPEQQAKRDALRSCLQAVKDANAGAEKTELRELARPCFEQAGVTPGRIRAKLAGARECLAEVQAANPGAGKATLRPLVKACIEAR